MLQKVNFWQIKKYVSLSFISTNSKLFQNTKYSYQTNFARLNDEGGVDAIYDAIQFVENVAMVQDLDHHHQSVNL